MIEEETLEIVADQTDSGERLNGVVDQNRCGRDVSQLVVLLEANNAEHVSIGAWILGELHFDLYCSDQMLSRLHLLTDHVDPAVRFHAFAALFPALKPDEASTRALLQKLRNDPNDGVRMAAEAATTRLSLSD